MYYLSHSFLLLDLSILLIRIDLLHHDHLLVLLLGQLGFLVERRGSPVVLRHQVGGPFVIRCSRLPLRHHERPVFPVWQSPHRVVLEVPLAVGWHQSILGSIS